MVKMVICPVCGENVDNKKICPKCGSAIRIKDSIDSNSSNNIEFCINCGEKIDNNSQFCSTCGYDIKNDVPIRDYDIPKKPTITKNRNTLFYIIAIIAIIIILATAISIYQNNTTKGNTIINNIHFNIPNGYTTDMQKASWFESGFKKTFPYDNLYYELQVYSNGYDDIAIVVINAPIGSNINNIGGQSMSINGHNGKLVINNGVQMFCYISNGKIIGVAGNIDTIKSVII